MGSVKKTGLYDTITHLLRENGIEWQELSGVQSNPKIGSVREGVRLVREHQLDCVLAVGGGSTLDCSKAICAGVPYAGDPWELVLDRTKVQDCLPLITVLTMAATGSEMDNIAVISNPETKDKRGFSSYGMYPRFSSPVTWATGWKAQMHRPWKSKNTKAASPISVSLTKSVPTLSYVLSCLFLL